MLTEAVLRSGNTVIVNGVPVTLQHNARVSSTSGNIHVAERRGPGTFLPSRDALEEPHSVDQCAQSCDSTPAAPPAEPFATVQYRQAVAEHNRLRERTHALYSAIAAIQREVEQVEDAAENANKRMRLAEQAVLDAALAPEPAKVLEEVGLKLPSEPLTGGVGRIPLPTRGGSQRGW